MKRQLPTDLAQAVFRFFQDYLPAQRGMSLHTIRSYRDSLMLFLRYLTENNGRKIDRLQLNDFTADHVIGFLAHLEAERKNTVATRNIRLAALHTFARFLCGHDPEHMLIFQGTLNIPFKRGARRVPIDYLEADEVEALLGAIDRTTGAGRRDYALFATMLNTGARVQEILNLKAADIRFDPPQQVRLTGKGNKVRLCPIWESTAQLLHQLVCNADNPDQSDQFVFRNRRGESLTRFGVRYLLHKYLPERSRQGSHEEARRPHPHCLRHTTAVYLLKAGVDFATISQWLGHAHLDTTMRYAKADMDLKRQALSQVFPEVLGAPAMPPVALDGSRLTEWLRRL
jgi:site-specific recombinase XerD